MARIPEKFRMSEKFQKVDWAQLTERFGLNEKLRQPRTRKVSAIGAVAATGAATLAFGMAPDQAQNTASAAPNPVGMSVQLANGTPAQQADVRQQAVTADQRAEAEEAAEKKKRQKAAAEEMAAAKKEAAERAEKQQAADRSETRKQGAEKQSAGKKAYADNLDGWIRESLAIMEREGIPGTYEGIHRNIMRESGGDPRAINDWDINAVNGTPSKGLLQVIQPTFEQYHVEGTSWDLYDPVANITAACNYAADRYGSIDNVDSAY